MVERKVHKKIENRFTKMILLGISVEILFVFFGIVMLFDPELSNKLIGVISGSMLLLYSASLIYNFFRRDGAKIYSLNIFFGLIIGILGVILIVYPFTILKFVTICLGIFFILSGGVKLNYSLWLKKGGEESWQMTMINAIVLIILGILLLFNPFANLAVTQVIGAFLIITSAIKIASYILFKNKTKQITKIFW